MGRLVAIIVWAGLPDLHPQQWRVCHGGAPNATGPLRVYEIRLLVGVDTGRERICVTKVLVKVVLV